VVKQHLNSLKCVIAYYKALYTTPVQFTASIIPHEQDNDDTTVITLNTSPSNDSISHHILGMLVKPSLVVANKGVTSLFFKGCTMSNEASRHKSSHCHFA
jgi:hypothetical protein